MTEDTALTTGELSIARALLDNVDPSEVEEVSIDITHTEDSKDGFDTIPAEASENTKEEAVLLAIDQIGATTSTEINEEVGFTGRGKASSVLVKLREKGMVTKDSKAPEDTNCRYLFALTERGREWVDNRERGLEDNQYYNPSFNPESPTAKSEV